MSSDIKTFSIISLIFGILSLVFFCIPLISFLIALSGFVLGIIALLRASKADQPQGKAVAGVILSGIALLIGLVWNILVFDISRKANYQNFFKSNNSHIFNFPSYNNNNDIDTNFSDIDSLLLDQEDINNLDNSMSDTANSPGNAPE